MEVLFYFLLAYLLGSIPFALVVSLPQGVDPRKAGSGNPGATNVARLLGKKWGLVTFIGDAGKGIFALYVVKFLSSQDFTQNPLLYSGTALSAIVGHLHSVFLKFGGGKGVATTIGTFLILTPKALITVLPIFFLAVYISGYVSVGSLLSVALLPFLIYLYKYPNEYTYSALLLVPLIYWKHKDNIKRLIRGEEKSWKRNKV